MNGIDGTLGSRIDGRDADIHGIIPGTRALREIPLGSAGGRGKARFGKTHDAALRTPGCDIAPTFGRAFNKVG
jgi:hypothetical protein